MQNIKNIKVTALGLPNNSMRTIPVSKLGLSSSSLEYKDEFVLISKSKLLNLIFDLRYESHFIQHPFNADNYTEKFSSKKFSGVEIENASDPNNPKYRYSVTYPANATPSYEESQRMINEFYLSKDLYLNTMVAKIDNYAASNGHHIFINYDKVSVYYGYNIYYDVSDNLIQVIDKKIHTEKRYIAIKLRTSRVDTLLYFVENIYNKAAANELRMSFYQTFKKELFKTTDVEKIVFLFENAPSWIAENFKSKELIEYLKLILSYDVDGWFSGYVDGSCAFINVLRGFNTLEKCVDLYKFFKENPKFVKDTYHALDSTSVWEGVEQPNKTIFASFLTSLSYAVMGAEGVNVGYPTKTFYIGDGYTINTSAIGALDFNDTQYFLKQERTKLVAMIPLNNFYFYPLTYDEDLEEGAYYDPLQMVQLYDVTQKTVIVVPAIFLHDTASRNELAQIMKVVRIGVNVFIIAISIASLGSASPLIALAAAADVTFATADTIIALAEDDLSKEFVETWSKIYLVGGAVTAGPLLLNGIFKGGVKILDGTAKAEFKNFVRAFVLKVVLEKNIANFAKSTIKEILFVEQAIIADGVRIELAEITRLQNAGAIFIKGIDFDGKIKGYAIIYKGEEIASGTAKEVRKTLKDAWKASGAKLVEVLDDLLAKAKFEKILPKDCKIIVEKSSYTLKDLSSNEDLGLVLINNDYLEFAIYRKGLNTQITGKQIFNSLVEYLKYKKIPYKGIKGLWSSSSDNTTAFNKAVKTGMSEEEAAFETWTGARALEQGYRKVKIDKLIPQNPPYTSITLTFFN
jgi:hypothetical protein